MANTYEYAWDSVNKKKVYMGKYSSSEVNTSGHYGNNDAGQKHDLDEKSAGNKRVFVGSGRQKFVFYSKTKGTLTIFADNFKQAWQQAKLRGYSSRKV